MVHSKSGKHGEGGDMSEAMMGVNLVIATAGLAICVLGLVQSLLDRNLDARAHRFLVIIFSLLVVYVSFQSSWSVS